jgi:hypothetical protein
MAAFEVWKASARLADQSEVLLCQAHSRDYVQRWCRRLLREWSPQERGRVKSIALFRGEAGPTLTWQRDQDYRPPFDALLRPRRDSDGEVLVPVRPKRPARRGGTGSGPAPGEAVTAFVEPRPVPAAPASPEMTERYGLLLTWLSAAGAGSWATFVYVCQTLSLARTGREAGRIARRLVLLGHLGQSESGKRWWVVAPTLTPLADEPERYFLRGQRTPALLARLPIGCEEDPQPDAVGPARLALHPQADRGATSIQVGPSRFAFDTQGAGALAEGLPTWREWLNQMPAVGGLVLTKFTRERWTPSGWENVVGALYEDEGRTVRGESGLYRLSRDRPFRTQVSVFFDAAAQKFVRGDWYGLRFLARRSQGLPLTATWRSGEQCLLVPSEERWPLTYERVLIQASGLLPSRTGAGPLTYRHIPKSLAQCLCDKLKVRLTSSGPSVYRQLDLFS